MINLCFACDKNYLIYLYITLASILKNSDAEDKHCFYILQNDFTNREKNILSKLQQEENFDIKYLDVDEKLLEGCRKEGYHIPIQTFYRYLIADLVPNLDKIIYLDVDIEVCGSLKTLYQEDLGCSYIAGVPDHNYKDESAYKQRIGLSESDDYVNAGVLVFNLKQFRKNNLIRKLIDESIKNIDIYISGDQDALNSVCKGKIKIVDDKYNIRADRKLIKDQDVIIRHYIGKDKKLLKLLKYASGFPFVLLSNNIFKYLIKVKLKLTVIKIYSILLMVPLLNECLRKLVKCLKRK